MATKKQKEELIKVLKFTPCTYTLMLSGYGGETYAGVVDRKIYEYFKDKNIDISQYASEWNEDLWRDIPESMRPFTPGDAYECDTFWHVSGAEFSELNYITVTDEKGDTHWEQPCSYDLEEQGVTVVCSAENEINELDEGTVVFWGGNGEKGCFFDAEIELTAPFDPKKLTIYFEDCNGWSIISSVEYDGEELDGSNGYSTHGKWSEWKWFIAGDEEVYEGVERDEDTNYTSESNSNEGNIPVLEGEEEWASKAIDDNLSGQTVSAFSTLVQALNEARAENWNTTDVRPPVKGDYEVKFVQGVWPSGDVRTATWTGRSWKENGKKAPEMVGWREVEEE